MAWIIISMERMEIGRLEAYMQGFGYKKTMMQTLDYIEQYLQVGVAPYIGEYGDLHTWLMLKSKKNDLTSNWDTYPVLKFFKGNALVEFGYSDTSNWDIHLMYRF